MFTSDLFHIAVKFPKAINIGTLFFNVFHIAFLIIYILLCLVVS